MTHLSEEQLVLHYYGEPVEEPVDAHLAGCEACRDEYRRLQRLLNTVDSAPVPERPLDYGAAVWQRISPQVRGRWRFGWLGKREWMLAGVMAGMLVAAFLAGRVTQRLGQHPGIAKSAVRERVLLVAVGDHLERSQTILVELENTESTDIDYERQAAADLVESNRLFRQTAAITGDASTAGLLDDLERVLLEIANSPTEMSRSQLSELQKEIEKRGILVKVKTFASQMQERENKDHI